MPGVLSSGAETANASWIVVSVETWGVFVTISTVETWPLGMLPIAHVTTPALAVHEGSDPSATNDSPVASVSVSDTPVALSGPRLVTVAVVPRSFPPVTGFGTLSTDVSSRSAGSEAFGTTVLVTMSSLLVSSGSGVAADTVACTSKELSTATLGATVTTVTWTSAGPGATVPKSHVTVEEAAAQEPALVDMDPAVNPGGSSPTSFIPTAASGPSLCAVNAKVNVPPPVPGSGETLPLTNRSALGVAALAIVAGRMRKPETRNRDRMMPH